LKTVIKTGLYQQKSSGKQIYTIAHSLHFCHLKQVKPDKQKMQITK